MTTDTSKPAWSARCCCYNSHPSSSGRCTNRSDGPTGLDQHGNRLHGVLDPTRYESEGAVCEDCRGNCPCGEGSRTE